MRQHLVAALGAAVIVVVAACGGGSSDKSATTSDKSATTGTASAQKKAYTVGVIELFPSGFFTDFESGLKKVAAANNVKLIIQNANNDAAQESQFFQNFITQKVDAILATAVSPTGSLASFKAAQQAGIPVVCFNTCLGDADSRKYAKAFISSNQQQLGKITGEQIAKYAKQNLDGTANIGWLTCETFDVCKQRRKGFNEGLAGIDAKTVASQEGFIVDKAVPVAKSMLTAHPDINVIAAENEDAIVAAATAIKSAGKQGKVAVFGVGIDPRIAAAVASPDGIVHWATGQDPYTMGTKSLETALQVLNGKTVTPFVQYTPSPTYSNTDPAKAKQYIATHQ